MPDAVLVAAGKAIVAQLGQQAFSQEIAPLRSYADWQLKLEDSDLHVDVVPVTTTQVAELSGRGTQKFVVEFDIAMRKKFSANDGDSSTAGVSVDSIDPLVLLVQEIYLYFTKLQLEKSDVWNETKLVVLPSAEHLREWRQFTGVVRVQFRHDQPTAY